MVRGVGFLLRCLLVASMGSIPKRLRRSKKGARCRKQLRIVMFYHQASAHLLDCCLEVENNNDKMVGHISLLNEYAAV